MEVKLDTLPESERVTYRLRALYERYGYGLFRMSKFEEYDFYIKNKDFLSGGQIITFSDLGGKLLALKPDITLSIVKNTTATPSKPERVYYTESVYRVSRDVQEYKELFQIGLEFIGSVTPYVGVEVVALAAQSLGCIAPKWVLDVSHMGFLSGLLESLNLREDAKDRIRDCIRKKSAHALELEIARCGLPEAEAGRLRALTRLYGPLWETLEQAEALCLNSAMAEAVAELRVLARALSNTPLYPSLNLDFSVSNDTKYYNGLLLRGYIEGIPRAILTGGRYDPLLKRMGKELGAIGFAIDRDELERYYKRPAQTPPDMLILCDEDSDPAAVWQEVQRRTALGERVCVLDQRPEESLCPVVRFVGKEAVSC